MSAGAIIGGATAALGVYGSYKSAKSADKAADSASESARLQYDIAQQQLDFGKEQWDLYQNKILPLELEAQRLGIDAQQLAYQRGETDLKLYQDYYAPLQEQFVKTAQEGVQPRYEQVQRDARAAVDRGFDSAENQRRVELERRGIRPGSGAYSLGDTTLARGAAQAESVRAATQAEQNRVENQGFNQMAVALGRQPLAANPLQSSTPGLGANSGSYNINAAGNTAQGSGYTSANLANMYGNASAGGMAGAIGLGTQVYDIFNRYSNNTNNSGTNYSVTPTQTSYGNGASALTPNSGFWSTNYGYAEGGEIPQLSRGDAGVVNGPPGVDRVPATINNADGSVAPAALTAGEIVIPREVVMRKGTEFFQKLLEEGNRRKAENGKSGYALGRKQ